MKTRLSIPLPVLFVGAFAALVLIAQAADFIPVGQNTEGQQGTLTASDTLAIPGAATIATPLGVSSGGTGAANASDARANLSAQQSDATLTALAGLATAADRIPYFTGVDAAGLLTLGAFGDDLLGTANASGARTALELGSMAQQAANSVAITGGTASGLTNLSATTITIPVASTAIVDTFANPLASLLGAGSGTLDIKIGAGSEIVIINASDASVAEFGAGVSERDTILAGALTLGTDLAVTEGGTGASDASTARSNLGLAIGTNVQAYDADLAAIAGLTSAADKLPYFTGSGTAAVADFPAFGRTLVANTTSSDARDDLALGTAATPTFTSLTLTGASGAVTNKVKARTVSPLLIEGFDDAGDTGGTIVISSGIGAGTSSVTGSIQLVGGASDGTAVYPSIIIDAGLNGDTLPLLLQIQNLPTSDPGVTGALWNDANTLKISP